jgi:hypothetical protein
MLQRYGVDLPTITSSSQYYFKYACIHSYIYIYTYLHIFIYISSYTYLYRLWYEWCDISNSDTNSKIRMVYQIGSAYSGLYTLELRLSYLIWVNNVLIPYNILF